MEKISISISIPLCSWAFNLLYVDIGLVNCFLLSGNKPLPEAMLTKIHNIIPMTQ